MAVLTHGAATLICRVQTSHGRVAEWGFAGAGRILLTNQGILDDQVILGHFLLEIFWNGKCWQRAEALCLASEANERPNVELTVYVGEDRAEVVTNIAHGDTRTITKGLRSDEVVTE